MVQKKSKEPQIQEGELTCSKCGTTLPQNAKFCGHCGKKVQEEPLHCTNCGAEAKQGEKFCTTCGEPLHKEEDSSEEENKSAPKKINFAKLGIFLLILLLITSLIIAGVYYGPKLFKKQQGANTTTTDTGEEEQPTPQENQTLSKACEDECDFEGEAKCETDSFYYCEKKDGCLTKVLIDKCSTGFTCSNSLACESSSNKNKIYQMEILEELEDRIGDRLKVGDAFETQGKLGGKIQDLTCDITKIYKEYARYVCEKAVPKEPILKITRTEATTSIIKINIKNSGGQELSVDESDVHISILKDGNSVCGLSIKNLSPNINDNTLKVGANSEFELRLSFGDYCTIEPGQSYTYTLDLRGEEKIKLSGSFKT